MSECKNDEDKGTPVLEVTQERSAESENTLTDNDLASTEAYKRGNFVSLAKLWTAFLITYCFPSYALVVACMVT